MQWTCITSKLKSNTGCDWLCHDHRLYPATAFSRRNNRREDSLDTNVPIPLQTPTFMLLLTMIRLQKKAHPLLWSMNQCWSYHTNSIPLWPTKISWWHYSEHTHRLRTEHKWNRVAIHRNVHTKENYMSLPNCYSHACIHEVANSEMSSQTLLGL